MTSICFRQKYKHGVYKQLMNMIPGLKEHLLNGSEEEILHVADLFVTPYVSIKSFLINKC